MPTVASGLTALLSVLFFLGLSNRFGDAMLGEIILVQTAAALVQIALIPSSIVYLLGAQGEKEAGVRYSEGLALEWMGTPIGLGIVAIGQVLAGPAGAGAVMIYLSLSLQASFATMGLARVRTQWHRYMLWILMPNLIRVPLVWGYPWLADMAGQQGRALDRAGIIFLCFLVPDIIRFLTMYVPTVLSHFRWPGLDAIRTAAREIYRNWFYDVGSAVTDQADKLVVGALFGPFVLVAYFFARRIGVVTAMVTEPFYMEWYRRLAVGVSDIGVGGIWARGVGFALGLWAAMALVVVTAAQLPAVAHFMPNAVVSLLPLFVVVLLIDCLLAANRWSRFLAQLTARSVQLFTVRLAAFGLFALVAIMVAPGWPVWGVAAALAAAFVAETAYVRHLIRTAV